MAVVLAASALTAPTAIFTRVTADALPYQDWPMFLQNPLRTAATTDPKPNVSRFHPEAEISVRRWRACRCDPCGMCRGHGAPGGTVAGQVGAGSFDGWADTQVRPVSAGN
jgi:hypothetical protein